MTSKNLPYKSEDGDTEELVINDLIDSLDEQYKKMKHEHLVAGTLKSNAGATECRNNGNESFKRARDFEAIEWYTKSVASAEQGSQELALAYANRSAVLYRLRQYIPCLHDINRALAGNYPEKLRNKLRDRKAQCVNDLVRDEGEPGKKLEREEVDATDPLVVKKADEEAEWRKQCKFGNPLIPNASSKIKIECDNKWGRFIRATEDIEPGEILSWQKFAVLTVQPDKRFWYCSYCLSMSYALIPCSSCVTQLYCSQRCRDLAHNAYHRIECKVLSYRTMPPTSESDFLQLMALRMLLIGTEQGKQLQNLMEKLTVRDVFIENEDPTNKPWSSNYLSALRLYRTFNPSQLKSNVAFVMKAILVLQKVEFFQQDLECEEIERDFLKVKELFASMLLLNHVVSVFGCKFAILGLASSDISNTRRGNTLVMGSGFCALHNLLNHSCDPDVRFFTRNRKHVLVSVRPIKKGEQIFYSYFGSFSGCPKAERVKESTSLGFTCECKACINDWPVERILMNREMEFLSKNKQAAAMAVMDTMWPITDDDITKLDGRQVLEILSKVCKWLHENVKAPCVNTLLCENRILDYFMLLYDDFSREHLNVDSKRSIILTLLAIKAHISKVAEVE